MYTHVFISCWMDAGSRTVLGMHGHGDRLAYSRLLPLVTIDDSMLAVDGSGGNG